MNKIFRIAAEKYISLAESVEERIANAKGIFTLKVPILMYHHIGNPCNEYDKPWLFVSPETFAGQMDYLLRNNFQIITLDGLRLALLHKTSLPKKSIILTFDDGYKDFYLYAYPVLRRYNLKATIFITIGCFDKPGFLTQVQLKKLVKSGLITIGSHTVNHLDLTKLPLDILEYELKESKQYLEDLLQTNINSLAYPFGKYNNIVKQIADKYYKFAVTTKYGLLQEDNKIFELKRIRLGYHLQFQDFKRRITL